MKAEELRPMVYYYVYVKEFQQVLEMRYLRQVNSRCYFNSGSMLYHITAKRVERYVFDNIQEAQEHFPELF